MKKKILFISGTERETSVLEFLLEQRDVEFKGIVDKGRHSRVIALAEEKNIPVFEDFKEIKNFDEIDAVVELSGDKDIKRFFESKNIEVLGKLSVEILLKLLRERKIYYELDRLTAKLNPSLGLEEILVILIGSTLKILKADKISIFIKTEEGLISRTSWGMDDSEIEEYLDYIKREEEVFKEKEILEKNSSLITAYRNLSGEIFAFMVIGRKRIFVEEERKLILQIRDKSTPSILAALKIKSSVDLSLTDGLTGLYNHRSFQERLSRELERAYKYDLIFSLIMMDIDDFKKYNDTYGHLEGDHLLRSLSQMLKYTLRETDFIARYGGEEFAIILPETNKQGGVIAAERIRRIIEAQTFGKEKRRVTASFGVSSYPEDGVYKDVIIKKADDALYTAKKDGKNKVVAAKGES